MNKQSGFTLVEIAIVLVIIGLLLGGVLKGQELINSAKVKSLTGDFRTVSTFVYAYQDRFKNMPGDDPRAVGNVGGQLATTPSTNPDDVRGNSRIEGLWNSITTTDESYLFWEHVRRANLAVGPTSASGTPVANFTQKNSEAGRLGITGIAPGGAAWGGSFYICSANIAGRFARQMDVNIDDGNTTTGSLRVFLNDDTAANDTTPIAANLTPNEDSTLYSVCVAY
jgi:prepilin-type N-terminal cleavage/methylation domain-containing protein